MRENIKIILKVIGRAILGLVMMSILFIETLFLGLIVYVMAFC